MSSCIRCWWASRLSRRRKWTRSTNASVRTPTRSHASRTQYRGDRPHHADPHTQPSATPHAGTDHEPCLVPLRPIPLTIPSSAIETTPFLPPLTARESARNLELLKAQACWDDRADDLLDLLPPRCTPTPPNRSSTRDPSWSKPNKPRNDARSSIANSTTRSSPSRPSRPPQSRSSAAHQDARSATAECREIDDE